RIVAANDAGRGIAAGLELCGRGSAPAAGVPRRGRTISNPDTLAAGTGLALVPARVRKANRMDVAKTSMPGVLKLHCHRARDERGSLVKFFDRQQFIEHNLLADFVEDLYTHSRRGVLRGMHFQAPPHAQTKLLCCIA